MVDSDVAVEKLSIKKRSVKDLADYIKIKSGISPNYALFLGAGASVTSGIRTGHELVQEWREEIYTRLSEKEYSEPEEAKQWLSTNHPDWYDQNNEYSSLFEKKFDLPSQRRRFVELQVDKKFPSIGYAYLVELFELKFFDTVFTTNFDDLINEAFYQFSSERPLLCAHDSSIKGVSITSSRPKIIKLHGDYLFDSIKSSLRETESLENNTREKLLEFAKEYGLIFVGYAGNDTSIMDTVKYLLKDNDYLRNGIYWCRKKGDTITSELFKLLNHEKVYWVEIDGFDEFMAELLYQLGGELSLGGSQKSTRREKMINNFLKDSFHLSKNQFIELDLKKIKKNNLTKDISSLINELSQSEDDDQRIPEEDFRNLLSIDKLIRSKKYSFAENKLNDLIKNTTDDEIKPLYLKRLITIKEEQKNTKSALEYSDKLIELDEFNISYSLSKSNIFVDRKDKIKYLKELLPKFQYSISLKNHLCRVAINYLNNDNGDLITFEELNKLIEESLFQDNSLENRAWKIKYDAIKCEHQTKYEKEQCNKLVRELLEKIKEKNPIHDTYLNIYSDFSCSQQNKEEIIECISSLAKIYEHSSKIKKRSILKYLTDLYSSLFDTDYEIDERKTLMKKFIDEYNDEKDIAEIASFTLFKARYEIGCNKNLSVGIELAKEALNSRGKNSCLLRIIDILLFDKANIPLVEDLIDNLSRDISNQLLLEIKCELFTLKSDYKRALECLDEAFKEDLISSSYIIKKTYINLLAENYQDTINIVTDELDKIKNVKERDVLIINREFAKKKLNLKINESEVRTVISRHRSKGEIAMCAFFLLDDESDAKRELKNLVERDFMNYYNFLNWPAVPKNILSSYISSISSII